MTITSGDISAAFLASMEAGERTEVPYVHWVLRESVPAEVVGEIASLPFDAPSLGGVSGKRELHNATRTYFDGDNRERYDVVNAFAEAFQSRDVTQRIAQHFGTEITGAYLRIEYAQDTNGFWLEPHTDLGVKLFTMLLYCSDDPSHHDLGTDIYDADKQHVGRSPFAPGTSMVFVPSDITYHGFEQRPIQGIRKSVIINYVTDEWRAREQLAFPDQPVA